MGLVGLVLEVMFVVLTRCLALIEVVTAIVLVPADQRARLVRMGLVDLGLGAMSVVLTRCLVLIGVVTATVLVLAAQMA